MWCFCKLQFLIHLGDVHNNSWYMQKCGIHLTKANLMYISILIGASSIVHTTSTNSRLSCHHMPPYHDQSFTFANQLVIATIRYFYSHNYVVKKIRHSAHTHSTADPVHIYYSPENISLSIYMVGCYPRSTCCHVVHFLSSHTIHLNCM